MLQCALEKIKWSEGAERVIVRVLVENDYEEAEDNAGVPIAEENAFTE